MKLPNGYGTVYKLKGNRRRPWIARRSIGEDKGRTIYQTIGYYETSEIAFKALTKSHEAPLSSKADITLEELYKEWSSGKYEYISKQTADCYRASWRYLSKFGKVKFTDLRTAQIQSVIDKCYRPTIVDGQQKKGMSRSSLKNIKIVAGMLYDYAMQNDIVNKNYAEFIRLPKTEKEEKETFSDLEIQILEKAENEPWVDTILILIYTGLRINEFLSLTKFSIDWDNLTITGGLKTDAGKDRIIPIHPKILKHINKWYDKNGERLICNEDGKKIRDKYYRENFYYPTLDKLKVRKLTPHSCRHTCASLLAKAGADTIAIQKIMGHTKYAFTADNYTHTDLEELKKAMNKM